METIMEKDTPGRPEELNDIVNALLKDYHRLEKICSMVLELVNTGAAEPEFALYLDKASALTNSVQAYLSQRTLVHMPYVLELAEKSDSGHNCEQCGGRCDMQHTMRLYELISSMEKMLNTVETSMPEIQALFKEDAKEINMRSLNNTLKIMNGLLRDIMIAEISALVPKVKEAQKVINANS